MLLVGAVPAPPPQPPQPEAPAPPSPVLPADVEALFRRLLALRTCPRYIRVVAEKYLA